MIFGFADIWLEKVLEVLENPFCRLTAFCFLNYWHINDMNLIEEIKNYEPVHIESKSTQKRVDMRNNTHSFSVNSFYLIVF